MDGLKKVMEYKMNGMEANMNVMEANMNGVEAKMDGLKNDMEAKIDGIEEKLKGNMEDMKNDIKADMEGLTKLIQEMIPNGEKIVEETHDEKKLNVNHDFINLIVGWKTHHIPKINMRKFDGKDPVTWILQMELYFDLNSVKNIQKVCIELYI